MRSANKWEEHKNTSLLSRSVAIKYTRLLTSLYTHRNPRCSNTLHYKSQFCVMLYLILTSSHIHSGHFSFKGGALFRMLEIVILGKASLTEFIEYQEKLNHFLVRNKPQYQSFVGIWRKKRVGLWWGIYWKESALDNCRWDPGVAHFSFHHFPCHSFL